MEKFDKRVNKMDKEALQGLLALRQRGGQHKSKKGKGSYSRAAFKKGGDR